LTTQSFRLENLQIISEWVKEKLTTEKVKYKLLLSTENWAKQPGIEQKSGAD